MNKFKLITPLISIPSILLPICLTACGGGGTFSIDTQIDTSKPFFRTNSKRNFAPGEYRFEVDLSSFSSFKNDVGEFYFGNSETSEVQISIPFAAKNFRLWINNAELQYIENPESYHPDYSYSIWKNQDNQAFDIEFTKGKELITNSDKIFIQFELEKTIKNAYAFLYIWGP